MIRAQVIGDIRDVMAGETARVTEAVSREIAEAGRALQAELRAATLSAGLGGRVANAWRLGLYPKGRPSLGAAATVWGRAPLIVEAFSSGVPIRPRNGTYLAIPTRNVPRRNRRRMTPVEVEARYNTELVLVERPGRPALLVLPAVASKSKQGFRQATAARVKSGRGAVTVVMFIRVRSVNLGRRLDLKAIELRAASSLAARLKQIL